MFPSVDTEGGGSLEQRLRGLILSNANAAAGNTNPSTDLGQQFQENDITPSDSKAHTPIVKMPLVPPHMRSATLAEQQEYLARANSRTQSASDPKAQSPHSARKRPNQAQRRQMNSQLSIPVDTRPSHSGRAYRSGSNQVQPQWGAHLNGALQNHQPRYGQNQQYPSRNQQDGPSTTYSPRNFYAQNSPRSSVHSRQPIPHNQNTEHDPFAPRTPQHGRQLFQPSSHHSQGNGGHLGHSPQEMASQGAHLEDLLHRSISTVVIDAEEVHEKEAFRLLVERACRDSIAEYEQGDLGNKTFDPLSVELKCFGSMMSGFATRASDMDLAILSPKSIPSPDSPESPIPRILEKKLLGLGFGARLLTRTRVPIIKLCEKPTEKLKADLLEERMKWENGSAPEPEEEEVEGDLPQNEPNEQIAQDCINTTPVKASSKPVESSYDEKLATLKQKERQSLVDYLNSAKRLLRRLGGRDMTPSSADLNEDESRILNDICKALISGLWSSELASRLKGYQSITPIFDVSLQTTQRTLNGVSIQIEGERLAMSWDERSVKESDERREVQGLAAINAWRSLGNKEEATRDYDRALGAALERLRKLSSLQLMCLEQMPHEEPSSYQIRTQKLLEDLRGSDTTEEASGAITSTIVSRYIAGIVNKSIRETLQASLLPNSTLHRIALRHRILQLKADYEHALSIDYFDQSDRPYVGQYLEILNGVDLTESNKPAKSASEINLITKIRTLPDPTAVSANKPRDRYRDHLEFPKTDIGIQCDINFSAQLALHNTLLLRCYSHCDPRVRLMILFVKHWAKVRGINTPYRGSLSSYGYVLMVLHYLVNVAQPFVCPNLQAINRDPPPYLPPSEIEARTICNGRDVRFWRNEAEIKSLAEKKMLNHNHESVGELLRGFFEYFAQSGQMTSVQHRGFDWGREVLSLRTMGGILSKQEKGWVGAKTTTIEATVLAPPNPKTPTKTETSDRRSTTAEMKEPKVTKETKEIRHRYLFALEDPFELDHNVARTVTHNGIVSIRDEFRRAWRIIRNVGREQKDGGLLDPLEYEAIGKKGSWQELLDIIHGPEQNSASVVENE